MNHVETQCLTLEKLDRVRAIRAIHAATQLIAGLQAGKEIDPEPVMCELCACLSEAGHTAFAKLFQIATPPQVVTAARTASAVAMCADALTDLLRQPGPTTEAAAERVLKAVTGGRGEHSFFEFQRQANLTALLPELISFVRNSRDPGAAALLARIEDAGG